MEEEYAPELKSSVGVYNNYMRQRKCHAFLGLCLEALYIEQPEQPVSFIIRFLRQKYPKFADAPPNKNINANRRF